MNSKRKTVLIFSEWYHPGYKAGGPITSLTNLVNLIGDSITVKIVCGDRDYLETKPYDGILLSQWCNVGKAEVYYLPRALRKFSKIKELLTKINPDVIYVNAMFSRVFTIYPILAAKGGDAKIVLAPRGMLAPSALQIKKRKKLLFLKLAKRFDVFASVSFHATNRVEADQVNKTFFRNKVVVLENVPTFREHEFQVNTPLKRSNMLNLYMVARVAPEKNIHFALHCLREIEGNNRVTLKVIGPIYDQSYFEGCKKIIARLKPNVTVEFLGPKTQNEILSIANQSDFFYLPTAGENYGHAIVEALLSNVPVIISNLTPWRNLQHHNLGFDLPLDPEKFTEAINNCASLSNNQYSKLYENIGVTAQSLININNLHKGYLKLFNGRD